LKFAISHPLQVFHIVRARANQKEKKKEKKKEGLKILERAMMILVSM
jgi:hypothetical protein